MLKPLSFRGFSLPPRAPSPFSCEFHVSENLAMEIPDTGLFLAVVYWLILSIFISRSGDNHQV